MAPPTDRIRGFDALRAIAFLWVFVSHQYAGPATGPFGASGVWLFFVLSGFLITRILANARTAVEAGTATVWRKLGEFYTRRTLRIAPVYYLFLAVTTVLFLRLGWMGTPERQLSTWLFLYNLYVEQHGWGSVVDPVWSLAVEEQFYILFAPLALLTPRRWLWAPCLLLLAISVTAHLVLGPSFDLTKTTFDVNSLINFGLLAIGGLAGLAADRPLPRWLSADPAVAAVLTLVLLLPALAPSMLDWYLFGRATGLVTALLLIQIYQNQAGRVVAVLNWAPMRELGVISYGAYLFQVLARAEQMLAALGLPDVPKAIAFLLNLAITVTLAYLSWRFFERPVRDGAWLRAFRRSATARP